MIYDSSYYVVCPLIIFFLGEGGQIKLDKATKLTYICFCKMLLFHSIHVCTMYWYPKVRKVCCFFHDFMKCIDS